MARYGYARVSTDMQSVDAQLPALEAEKLDMIFVETVSGAVPARERPVLASLLDRLQPDDSLVVVRLDRLGRDAIDMLQLVSALDERNVRVRILSLGIETGTANGRLFLTILMAIAEFERELIRERTRAGIAAARAAGRRIGRPRALTSAQTRHVRTLAEQGLSIRDVASVMNVGRATVHRALKGEAGPQRAGPSSSAAA
ncbi:recombinase family protein [Asaia bogorensis]|uniref:Resolvase n=1 Tax=Asaia bogorensis NBRC 16594 TaxID=1231624 RepID=A0AAN4R3X4_9PROT|nr:recombinase family protein [Asaia bogorensis]BAT20522.1 DNA recombinase/resolvase [Asaia bogorensis NBRC 16594]GBQ79043.1 DNA-invertase [Asaia bogorensis NBRC 16594]GEL52054.1 putative resolvase [Asaia bogorensis NBRC 16594]